MDIDGTKKIDLKKQIFSCVSGSTRGEGTCKVFWTNYERGGGGHLNFLVELTFVSVAMTTPLLALIPREIFPLATAVSAYSSCTSLPDELKVVKEN
jgi:hypothetical protein